MRRIKYRDKLLLSFTGIFAVFAIVMVLFEMHYEREIRVNDFRSHMLDYSDAVAHSIRFSGDTLDSSELQKVKSVLSPQVRFTVIERTGRVVYDSGISSVERMDNHSSRPEVANALRVRSGSYDIRYSTTMKINYFYYAKAYGKYIVRVARPYDAELKSVLRPANVFLMFILLVFPIVIVMLIYISDSFGRSVSQLRQFIENANKGQYNYDIKFSRSELGEIGRQIVSLYKQVDEAGRKAKIDRERLLQHFRYFDGGIAIFNTNTGKVFSNPLFMQYINTILPKPTGDVNTIWNDEAFQPAKEFLALNSKGPVSDESVPVTRFNISAGSARYAVQLVIYSETDFEMTIHDVTRAEKNRVLKQQMSNNITHELRTPVSSVRGYIETILQCKGLSDERKRYFLERAYNQVIRLSELIRDVAIITKVEEAPELMEQENMGLRGVFDDVTEELGTKISEAGINVENALDEKLTVYGNYSLIYSIFRNLVENSIRYAGHGVTIHVECYNTDDDFCYLNYYDTGKGCAEEHLPRIFERFYRAEAGRTRDTGGSGLGLSIVKNSVIFHHGNISVRNRKEGGLQFLFTLQRHQMK